MTQSNALDLLHVVSAHLFVNWVLLQTEFFCGVVKILGLYFVFKIKLISQHLWNDLKLWVEFVQRQFFKTSHVLERHLVELLLESNGFLFVEVRAEFNTGRILELLKEECDVRIGCLDSTLLVGLL